ncbi:MAG TPA: carboxypeptidase-like regulatory domain-containing protein [Mucilaginibacter sp.]|nr:carboxypeptidase-like regulatory domain-containing protein [Mucilaginibacter sp.]
MRLKLYLLLPFLSMAVIAKAQMISGRVLADTCNSPLAVIVTTYSGHRAASDNNGEFHIAVSGIGDTVRISAVGYKTYLLPIRANQADHIVVRLKQAPVALKNVQVTAIRDHKADSIALRRHYAKVFNYQSPKLTDAMAAPPSNVPFAFVSIDLLKLVEVLTKKSDPNYKMKQLLLKDEQSAYIATRFNRSLVTRETGLKGDSLNLFMDKYYPTAEFVRKTNDYDLIMYIKARALEFRKHAR